jgi:hypothetical protein
LITYAYSLPSEVEAKALAALHGVNGPVGGTRTVGLGDGVALGLALEVGEGLVVSDGLGVGAATAGLTKRASAKEDAATMPAEILK